MKSLILCLFLTVGFLTVQPSAAEAGPIRRAIAWKREHRPVLRWFRNRKPLRRAIQWKREHRPIVRFFFVCDVDHEELPV